MSVLIKDIYSRINLKNKNFLGIITGETGSGKSLSALTIAQRVDPNFNIDQVVFTPKQFMALLNSGSLEQGNMIVWDEAGVGIPAKEWYTIANRVISYVLQTFRHENLGVLFTTPSLAYIDRDIRRLFHGYLETEAIDRVRGWCICKYFRMVYYPREDKIFYKYPQIWNNGSYYTVKRVRISKPNEDFIEEYKEKKKEFTTALKRTAEKEIGLQKKKGDNYERRFVDIHSIVQEILQDPKRFVRKRGKRKFVDKYLVMNEFDVGDIVATRIKKKAEAEFQNAKVKKK